MIILLHKCIVCKCFFIMHMFVLIYLGLLHIKCNVQICYASLHIFVLCVAHYRIYCSRVGSRLFLHGLHKNSLSTVCPAFIQFLVDIRQFLSSLLAVPGPDDGSSTGVIFKFKLLLLLLLHFDSRRSLQRDGYRIAQST